MKSTKVKLSMTPQSLHLYCRLNFMRIVFDFVDSFVLDGRLTLSFEVFISYVFIRNEEFVVLMEIVKTYNYNLKVYTKFHAE